MALKDDNFFVIQGWMINKLDINNKELLVFALIHSFTQVDDTWFTGSINYIAECTKSSRSTTMNALSSLLEKQLIIREEVEVDFANYKYYKYRINRDKLDEILYRGIENNTPGVEITPVSVESTPNKYILSNNINNNNNNINNIVPKICGGSENIEKSSKEVFNQLKSKKGTKYSTKNVIDELFSHYEELYNCKYPESNFSKLTVQIQKLQEDYGCTLNELSTKIIEWMDYWKSSDWQQEDGNFILPTAVWVRNKLDSKVPKNGNSKKVTYDVPNSKPIHKTNNRRIED